MDRLGSHLESIVAKALHRAPAPESPLLAWPVTCGSAVAERTRAVSFASGVLLVEVSDAGWRQVVARQVDRLFRVGRGDRKPPKGSDARIPSPLEAQMLVDLILVQPSDIVFPNAGDQVLAEAPIDGAGSTPMTLTASEVDTLLKRAAAASASTDAIIAITDRLGRILGVRVEGGVDPAITTKFWFTGGSARLDSGKPIRWEWKMYGFSVPVTVIREKTIGAPVSRGALAST